MPLKSRLSSIRSLAFLALLPLGACGGNSEMPPPTLMIGVSPTSIVAGQKATLAWSSSNASMCQASGAWAGLQSTSGSLNESPANAGTYTYTLACTGSASVTESATLTVIPALAMTGMLSNGVVGTPFNQTIQAAGGVAPFTWTVSSGALPHNLALSASTTNAVIISGTPDTATQAATFTIQVKDSSHQTASQAFTISILAQADSLTLTGNFEFSNQLIGSPSAPLTMTLTNTGSSAIAISSVTISTSQTSDAGEFTQMGTTCGPSLAAGSSCAINVVFTPDQTGPRHAVLTISDDAAGSPQSVALDGAGLSAGPNATLSAASLPFGIELVGTISPPMMLSLTNYGVMALNVGSVSATGSFAETDSCLPSVASGATCHIAVTFTPGGSGDVTGTLSIADDVAGGQQVALSGTGSTNTPPLNGYCLTSCGLASDPTQCPVGQPSEHPVSVEGGRVCGVGPPEGSFVLDEARSCSAMIRGRRYAGVCEAGN